MNTVFKLSLRNLTRQKRRNAILAIAIAFGFFVVTVIDGLTTGMVGNLEKQMTQLAGGTILIQGLEKTPSLEEGKKSHVAAIVRDKNYIRNLIEENHINYESLSCYSMSSGQLIFEGKKAIVQMYGRDLTDPTLIDSFQFVEGGVENFNDPHALVINDKTAESLNLSVGDTLLFTTTTIYDQNTVDDFTVAGIYKSNSILNALQVYTHLETLNKLIEIPEDGYSTFTFFLKNSKEQNKVAMLLEQKIREDGINVTNRVEAIKTNPSNIGKGIEKQIYNEDNQWEGTMYAVETIDDEIPQIKQIMSVVHTVTTVILIVILLIVMVGVSNTYRMVLYERIREIGTMRAIGMDGKSTGSVFTTEAVILCIIGACLGIILAGIVMFIIHLIPISSDALSLFLHNGHFSFTLSVGTIIIQYLLLIILTSIAVHGSAKKAAKMNPAEALRTIK